MGDLGMIKEGLLAWKLCGEALVVSEGGALRVYRWLRVYRKINGENEINTRQTNASHMHALSYMRCRGVLMHYWIYLDDLGK